MILEKQGVRDKNRIGKMIQLEKMDLKDWMYVLAIIIIFVILILSFFKNG